MRMWKGVVDRDGERRMREWKGVVDRDGERRCAANFLALLNLLKGKV